MGEMPGSSKIRFLTHKYRQTISFALIVCAGLLVCSPAHAFPTPEIVWVVGGLLFKPALIFFPFLLFLWRGFEWHFRWVHLRAYGNRKVAIVLAVFGLMCLGEFSDRIAEDGLPEPTADAVPLKSFEFENLLQEHSQDVLVVDLRSAASFNLWHIENSVNMPNALNVEVQTYFEKHAKKYNILLCYGGDRSKEMAHYLRAVYGGQSIRSVVKGVFALRLKEQGKEPYYVRQVAPGIANVWVAYGLASAHGKSSVRVDMGYGSEVVRVAPAPSPWALFVHVAGALRSLCFSGWLAFFVLLSIQGCIFTGLIYQRKKRQVLSRGWLPHWVEILLLSALTLVTAWLGTSLPEFYGRTAQQYPVFGNDDFSSLMTFYIGLTALPLTWHLRHTYRRKERDFIQRVELIRAGVRRPWSFKLYLNWGVILAFMVVVYCSVEVNCTALWALVFALWWTMLSEVGAEEFILRRMGFVEPDSVKGVGNSIEDAPDFIRAQKYWRSAGLEQVTCDARTLAETCHGANRLTHTIFLERLHPSGSQERGLRALGIRSSSVAAPTSRMMLIGQQLYRAAHPLLEGFHAGKLELQIQTFMAARLKSLWFRKAHYWFNHHLLPLAEKRVSQYKRAQTFREKKRCLNNVLVDLEEVFAPFQESAVRVHQSDDDGSVSDALGLSEKWLNILLNSHYVLAPEMKTDWSVVAWFELALPHAIKDSEQTSLAAALHVRASLLVFCLHEILGALAFELGEGWGYGVHVYELQRGELLAHGARPWLNMRASLQVREEKQKPWMEIPPTKVLWDAQGGCRAHDTTTTPMRAEVLSPAFSKGEGFVYDGDIDEMSPGAILVVDSLKPSDLPVVRAAKAIYCTRGSRMSHPMVVAREWGLPVFKISLQQKEQLLGQGMIAFEVDGSWQRASS